MSFSAICAVLGIALLTSGTEAAEAAPQAVPTCGDSVYVTSVGWNAETAQVTFKVVGVDLRNYLESSYGVLYVGAQAGAGHKNFGGFNASPTAGARTPLLSVGGGVGKLVVDWELYRTNNDSLACKGNSAPGGGLVKP